MPEPLIGAFIFISPGCDPAQHRAWLETPGVRLLSVAVNDYDEAAVVAKELAGQGVQAIELCGGFGSRGIAKVAGAVDSTIPVGAVRFDKHPLLEGKSGDDIFS